MANRYVSKYYYQELGMVENLSNKKIKEYFELARQGDKNAKRKLVENYLKMVVDIARQMSCSKLDTSDLVQIGNMALLDVIDIIICNDNIYPPYTSYVYTCIHNAIVSAIRANRKYEHEVLESELEDYPIDDEGMEDEYFSAEKIDFVNSLPFIVLKIFEDNELSNREIDVLVRYFGLSGEKESFAKIAKALNVGESVVGKIYRIALGKLRNNRTIQIINNSYPYVDFNTTFSGNSLHDYSEKESVLYKKVDITMKKVINKDYYEFFLSFVNEEDDNCKNAAITVGLLDEVYASLSNNFKTILIKLFGEDLLQRCYNNNLSDSEKVIFVYILIPMIKDSLVDMYKNRYVKKRKGKKIS